MSEINMLMVVDTKFVKKALVGKYSTDPEKPNHIDGQYMLVTGTTVNRGQGTMNVDFNARPGDRINFRGVSIYGNSEDAVIIYEVVHWREDDVFNRFVPDVITRSKAAVPDTTTKNGLPAVPKSVSFNSFDSVVKGKGTEVFVINFALYQLSSDGESQEFVSYMQCDPTIHVS